MIGFQAGDTVDLGASLAVGTLVYSTSTGLLVLENAAGATLEFAVPVNRCDDVRHIRREQWRHGRRTDHRHRRGRRHGGDHRAQVPDASGVSGAWQNGASWNNGIIPGVTDTAVIGFGETANFTLTTGAAPVSVLSISIFDRQASLHITSDTTVLPGLLNIYTGTLEVTGGNTLTSSALRTFNPLASVLIQAGGTVAVTGRPNNNLAAIDGTLTISQGNSTAVEIAAGTLVVDGALLAGPAATSDGGSFSSGTTVGGPPPV